ncbi:MAG: lysophospholipid acyltransferase family protein [Vulcanimicrobiota bacterium]
MRIHSLRQPRVFAKTVTTETGREIPYHGPADGRSHPNEAIKAVTKPVAKGLVNLVYRVEREGEMPEGGGHVLAVTHPSIFDPPMVGIHAKHDTRFVADVGLFRSSLGAKILTGSGAFPVNRRAPGPSTIGHMVEVVETGKDLCVFPEGGMALSEKHGKLGPIKKGAAFAAIRGGAKSVVPISITYQDNTQAHPGEKRINTAVATAIAAGTVLGATLGGPTTRAISLGLGAGLTAAFATGKTISNKMVNKKWFNPSPKILAILGGSLGAGIAGGTVVGLTQSLLPAPVGLALGVGLGVAGGLAAKAIGESYIDRRVAKMTIGEEIPVAPYLAQEDSRQAVNDLSVEIHRRLGQLKADQSGVPYDDEANKFLKGFVLHAELGH